MLGLLAFVTGSIYLSTLTPNFNTIRNHIEEQKGGASGARWNYKFTLIIRPIKTL